MPGSGEAFGANHESTYNNPANLAALGRVADGRGELSAEAFGENQTGFARPPETSYVHGDESPDNHTEEVSSDSPEQHAEL